MKKKKVNPAAGPELDRLVAEKVMGWKREMGSWLGHPCVQYGTETQSFHGTMTEPEPDFHPSTNVDHAWEVVAKVSAKHRFTLAQYGHENEEWCASFGLACEAFSSTVPHAICLAALSAVGAI